MTKERLKNYRALCEERDEIVRRITEIRARVEAPKIQRIKADIVSGGCAGEVMEETVLVLSQLQELYLMKECDIAKELLAIEQAIGCLPSREREILRARYIDGKRWETICSEKNYSWQHLHRIHAGSLRLLEDAIE